RRTSVAKPVSDPPSLAAQPAPLPQTRSVIVHGGLPTGNAARLENGRSKNRVLAPTTSREGASSSSSENEIDAAFSDAWKLYHSGRADAAAYAFDALLGRGLGARQSDVLYWSARAHLEAGRPDRAARLLEQLLRQYPEAWHAPKARSLLDEL